MWQVIIFVAGLDMSSLRTHIPHIPPNTCPAGKVTEIQKNITMRTKNCTLFIFLLLSHCLTAQNAKPFYKGVVDLKNVQDDKLKVVLHFFGNIQEESVVFCMPKTVPGVYSVNNFGRFVSDLQAFSKEGTPLEIAPINVNRWRIKGATSLQRLTYWVEDTFDTAQQENVIFEPTGTNIEADKNFVINTHGFFGYLRGYEQLPYMLSFSAPEGFQGSTSLRRLESDGTDIFIAESYPQLVDSPIMYCKPDVTAVEIGGTTVTVSVYSPNERITSGFVMESIKGTLEAQKRYMGNRLPVDHYDFIFYFFDGHPRSGSMGALEHNYSSFYSLPESMNPTALQKVIRDMAAHEFFHIITPLHLHAEEIAYFDFNDTVLSKHLWLYEGVTEYFAHHMQVQEGLIDAERFMEKMMRKVTSSLAQFKDDLSFTEMSKGVHDLYEDQYGNVYQKGALIAMCIDIMLRESSHGTYGLMQLAQELMAEYGPQKPFQDDVLFDVIVAKTYPALENFFTTYVAGSEPLPLVEVFSKVGMDYTPPQEGLAVAAGDFVFHENDVLLVRSDNSKKGDGYARYKALRKPSKDGNIDILRKVGRYTIRRNTMEELSSKLRKKYEQDEEVTCRYEVLNTNTGERKKKKSPCRINKEKKIQTKPTLKEKENVSTTESLLKEAWLGR